MAGEAAQSPPQRGRGQEHLAVHGWLPVGRPEYGVLERVVEQGQVRSTNRTCSSSGATVVALARAEWARSMPNFRALYSM